MSNNFDIVEALWLRREKKRRAQKIIEGTPPLTYTAKNVGTLKNYRIYGNTVDGESVGDRTANLFDGKFLQGYWAGADGNFVASNKWICTQKIPCKANTDYTFTFGNKSRWYLFAWYDIDGNYIESNDKHIGDTTKSQSVIFTATSPVNAAFMGIDIAGEQVGTTQFDIHPSDVTDLMLVEGSTPLPYEPYGYKVPVKIEGKNLLQNTATTQTLGADDTHPGITFTVNNDGSIIVNGSSVSAQSFKWEMDSITVGTQIILSGCPSGGGNNKHRLDIRNASLQTLAADSGNGATYTITGVEKYVVIRIVADYVCDNLTFYPMIRRAEIADGTYEPYQSPITTNIYLPEQIRKVGDEAEHIDYGEQKQHFADGTFVDVTLPALPTIAGTNTLTVGTEVQPSKVIVKGKIS